MGHENGLELGEPGVATQPDSMWQCCHCLKVWTSLQNAEICERWHKIIANQRAAFDDAQREGKVLLGNFLRKPQGDVLIRVLWVIGPDCEQALPAANLTGTTPEVLCRFYLADGSEVRDFFPLSEESAIHMVNRYLTIEEALGLGWCPFFVRGYQKKFPRPFREKMAAAFIAMPQEAQRQLLLTGQPFSTFPV